MGQSVLCAAVVPVVGRRLSVLRTGELNFLQNAQRKKIAAHFRFRAALPFPPPLLGGDFAGRFTGVAFPFAFQIA